MQPQTPSVQSAATIIYKSPLTHLPLDKMAAISQTIDNPPALVKIMAWRRIGDKPLSEPMLTRLTDAYMQHYEEMS